MVNADKTALFDVNLEPRSKKASASARGMYRHGAEKLNAPLITAVINGTMAIEIEPSCVIDDIQSDRLDDRWEVDGDMNSLIQNIKSRGQRQPIRVRPKDPNWRPSPKAPLAVSGVEFILQSGRRRLHAIKTLNETLDAECRIKVIAVLSTPEGDKELADLEERFSENTMRKDLNAFEKLRSIGQIALRQKDRTQRSIADNIGVSQALIPPAQVIAQHEQMIQENVDVSKASMTFLRNLAKKIRDGYRFDEVKSLETSLKVTATREPGIIRISNGLEIKRGRGSSLEVSFEDGSKLSSDHMEWVLEAIVQGVGRIGKLN